MAIGDISVVKVHQTRAGRSVLNVFTYRHRDIGVASENLANAWMATVGTSMLDLLFTNHTIDTVEAYNLFDPLDFAAVSVGSTGTLTGEPLPPFMAIGYRYERQRRDMRHGYKRIMGGNEDLLNGAVWNTGSVDYSKLTTFATQQSAIISGAGPAGQGVDPVVVKRIPYTTSEGNEAYRFPESQSEAVFYIVSAVSLLNPTTQNTRKS